MDASRREMAEVLRAARALLARPGNAFSRSSWDDAGAALREVDGLIAAVEAGSLPLRQHLAVLFAPTGPIQEVSLSSGWAQEFLTVAGRFDRTAEQAFA
jgi:hypothetical protein